MGILDWLKPRPPLYSGGSGETMEDAIVINARNTPAGVAAEYRYVSDRYGRLDADWTLVLQALQMPEDGRVYDVLRARLKNGEVKEFYFDITSFYGSF